VRAALIRFNFLPRIPPRLYEYIDSQCSWQVACPSLLIKNCDVYQRHLKQQTSVPKASFIFVYRKCTAQSILDITPECPTIYSMFGNRLNRMLQFISLRKRKTVGLFFWRTFPLFLFLKSYFFRFPMFIISSFEWLKGHGAWQICFHPQRELFWTLHGVLSFP